ncbi:MAG: 30S ribosomal protein S6e, partial [Thermoprotei archaeon]
MPEFKVVVSDPSTGKAKTYVVKGEAATRLIGLKIGDIIDGLLVSNELKGKKLEIRGGSDSSGFPMRPDIPGGVKKRVLL